MRPLICFKLISCFVLSQLFSHVSGQAMAAWYTGAGADVVMQNITSGDLLYSQDLGSGFADFKKLDLQFLPKPGTPIAGTGYQEGSSGSISNQIFYTTTSDRIVEAYISCTPYSGACVTQGNYALSDAVSTDVSVSTGLAAGLLGVAGYRVFYHDKFSALRELTYNYQSNITWGDGFLVSNSSFEANSVDRWGLSVTVNSTSKNITVFEVNDSQIQVLHRKPNLGAWEVVANITNLASWNGTNSSISTVIDTQNDSIRLFYIGTDSQVHHVQSLDQGFTWVIQVPQTADFWPVADDPSASIAAASLKDTISLFYMSSGNVIQAQLKQGIWQKYQRAVTYTLKTNTTSASNPDPTSSGSATTSSLNLSTPSSTSLPASGTTGVKIGLGVGIPLALAAVGLVSFFFWRRRRIAKKEEAVLEPVPTYEENKDWPVNEFPAKEPLHELGELSSRYELHESAPTYELHGADLPPRSTWEVRSHSGSIHDAGESRVHHAGF